MRLKSNYIIQNEENVEPVFSGLYKSGITGRRIADALKVSPALVSKWRRGSSGIPGKVQIFLTLMLADQVERLGELYAGWGPATPAWHLTARAELDLAREFLAEQERRNLTIPSATVFDGIRLFRVWWNADRILSDLVVKPTASVRSAALIT